MVESLLKSKTSFIQETTGTRVESLRAQIQKAKMSGYQIVCYKLNCPKTTCFCRAINRGINNRAVPLERVEEIYDLSNKYFNKYVDSFDTIYYVDITKPLDLNENIENRITV